ncbi:hypothetical protein J2X36_003372 [Methylobacterium sp. BE186]|uniref:hypothetical protein n=1 Tax=Methylobacterium sp. BE186 TaxID=2817715 RepID=UPI00285AB3FD|nr:hypothetical protein [Methylobacterium sp. BE186]MDR7038602.1 hypothetical protein [Methylobacterium sp. BE186]
MNFSYVETSRIRQNDRGSYSLYADDIEVISGLDREDLAAFYSSVLDPAPAEIASHHAGRQSEFLQNQLGKSSSCHRAEAKHPTSRARRGRRLSLLPHADLVRAALQQRPSIHPLSMALVLKQAGVKVYTLGPVRNIMDYCSR